MRRADHEIRRKGPNVSEDADKAAGIAAKPPAKSGVGKAKVQKLAQGRCLEFSSGFGLQSKPY